MKDEENSWPSVASSSKFATCILHSKPYITHTHLHLIHTIFLPLSHSCACPWYMSLGPRDNVPGYFKANATWYATIVCLGLDHRNPWNIPHDPFRNLGAHAGTTIAIHSQGVVGQLNISCDWSSIYKVTRDQFFTQKFTWTYSVFTWSTSFWILMCFFQCFENWIRHMRHSALQAT